MKKTLVCAGLMTLLCTTVYADNTNTANEQTAPAAGIPSSGTINATITPPPPQMPDSEDGAAPAATPAAAELNPAPTNQAAPATTPAANTAPATPTNAAPAPATNTPPAAPAPAPANSAPAPAPAPATPAAAPAANTSSTLPAETAAVPAPAPVINCLYHIPADTQQPDPNLVMQWAEKAAAQSFDLDYKTVDQQLTDLKNCYTDQGWQGFNDALQKSGNLNAIKTQQLMVTSIVNGKSTQTETKENQWKITVPVQVVYQNDKEKLTQQLTVNLVIGRKINGDLGIMQMIATPQQPAPAPTTPAPAAAPAAAPSPTPTSAPATPAQ